jgi:hypothetical protein
VQSGSGRKLIRQLNEVYGRGEKNVKPPPSCSTSNHHAGRGTILL